MENKLHTILYSVAIVLAATAILTGLAGSRKHKSILECKDIDIAVLDSSESRFICAREIRSIIDKDFGGYVNRPVDSLDLGRIENILAGCDILCYRQAYLTNDGILHIEVKQHTPVARVLDNKEIWYLCKEGAVFKFKGEDDSDLPVIEGPAPLSDGQWTRETAEGVSRLVLNGDWEIDGMTCDRNGNLQMKLAGHPETFILGRLNGLDYKCHQIQTYLDKINGDGTTEYKNINVIYKGQVVCK